MGHDTTKDELQQDSSAQVRIQEMRIEQDSSAHVRIEQDSLAQVRIEEDR